MNPADLEEVVGRKLRQLPVPRAPQTLLPRVLAAVQEWSLRPWYRRAWFTWPVGGQFAAVAAVVLVALVGTALLSMAQAAAAGATSTFTGSVMYRVAAVTERAGLTIAAARILWGTLVEPLLPYAFALVMLMCLACAAFGAVLNRVAVGRT
jgi:hypothetical protein